MGRHTTKLGEASRAEKRPPLPYPVRDGRVPPSRQEAADRRTQRRRSRLAALSAASMIAIGGAAGMSMAMADEPESSSGDEIVFSGDCGALGLVSPSSSPDASQVTVPEGSEVRYTNDLDTDAKLHVGTEAYDIGSGSSQVFVMNRSAEVAMVPDCHGVFAQYDSAQVNVVDAPPSEAEDDADDHGTADGREGADDQGGSDPSEAELPSPSSGDETSSEANGAGSDAGASGTEAAPREGDAQSTEGEDAAEESTAEEEVNSFGPGPGEDRDGAGFEPASDEVVAVDPKVVSDGANGLLAMIAIVCLVGVSAAVMRTVLKQRATA